MLSLRSAFNARRCGNDECEAERFKSFDSKRKNLVEELEERERAFEKARTEKQKEEQKQGKLTKKLERRANG